MKLGLPTRPAHAAGLKTKVKTISPSEQQLQVEVGLDRVATGYDAVYRDIQKEAELPGFRKGKAPRDLLERHYAGKAREEVTRRLIGDTLDEALRQEHIQAVGQIAVSDVQLNDATGLVFRATIEVAPQFKLGKYKGLALARPPVTVTDDDVQRVLTRLQESRAEVTPVEGSTEKETKLPALDDEFAKDVGLESFDALKARIRQDLTAQAEAQVQRQLEEAACEALLARTEFEVPRSLVERRVEQLKRDYAVRLLMQGVPEAELPEKLKPIEAQLTTNATKLVKLSFILRRIGEAEHIEVTTDEVTAHLAQLAQRWRCTVEQAKQHLEKERLWENLVHELLQEKAIRWLLAHAAIETATPPAAKEPHGRT